jgi:hypothetical protein
VITGAAGAVVAGPVVNRIGALAGLVPPASRVVTVTE